MNTKMIGGILIVGGIILGICTCCVKNKNHSGFDNDVSPYTKEETSNYNYELLDEKLVIKSNCSTLEIEQSDDKEVKVSIEKKLGGKDEEALNEELKKINCSYENGVLNIISNDSNSAINSRDVNTIIKVPEGTKVLEISNNVGDIEIKGNYDNITADSKVGDFSYKGETKKCNIDTKIGDIDLDLKAIANDYAYNITANVGDVKISVPKNGKVNLIKKDDVKISDGVKIDNEGMTLDVTADVGDVKIKN